ncbi:putative Golgi to vacuole transport-related protein [Kockovaella imperatae]|uniref:Putative Golgi to vacuole transport-related protein n=1 Tax=Kockovaella imperatae TaxID=4999 RepID=A0A1Y1UMH3_9TREE|nr:putative Golgi to vacuole transport-related protein [Kockovaella imperatae]ORX39209.1 putative Golgi to vacuole transport-related protein [Kockovaella imperatae]
MIHAVLIFNTHGKPRLSIFYTPIPPLVQQSLIAQIFSLISDRPAGVCNFLDAPDLVFPLPTNLRPKATSTNDRWKGKDRAEDDDTRVIYRHYATLYFVFVVDGAESELGILDLIQVFVESLDRSFESVCELDLIFHFDEVHHVLSEIIQGGLVLETNINEISLCVRSGASNRKASAASANPIIPTLLSAPGSRPGRGSGPGDGPRRWLAAMGV